MRFKNTRRVGFEALENRYMMAAIPGDYNASGVVDTADYTLWKSDFGSSIAKTSIVSWPKRKMSRRRLSWSVFGALGAAIITLIACAVDSLHGEWIFLQYLFYPVTFLGALLAWFYEGDNSPQRLYYLGCLLSFAINIPLGSLIGFLIANHRGEIA